MAAAMATRRDPSVDKILLNYDSFTKKCENYVCANDEAAENIKSFLKALYSKLKGTEEAEGLPSGETLPELITDNFDEEQIWQELELQNEARVDALVGNVARLVAQKDKFAVDVSLHAKPKEGREGSSSKKDESSASDDDDDDDDKEASDDDDIPGNNYGMSDDDEIPDIDELSGDEQEEDDSAEIQMSNESENDDASEDDSDEEQQKKKSKLKAQDKSKSKRNVKPSIVDDKFFKLSEMEEFLEREEQEKGDSDSSDESIDLFDDMSSDDEDDEDENDEDENSRTGKEINYSDFFDAPEGDLEQDDSTLSSKKQAKSEKKKKVSWEVGTNDQANESKESKEEDSDDAEGSDDSDSSDLKVPSKSETKSSFEIRQERLKAKIKQLEDEALTEKAWQLRGEVSGEARPENALLEEALEFDLTHRPAPVITEETTQRLEDIIKQRIKDKAWDDVERKQKPVETPNEFKKKLVLDQEKSKLSLAQVYEQEYLKQVSAANPETSDKPEEIPKEHVEIQALVDSLFRKLDALANFHYTPKQVAPEVKIVTNLPAINMEEVAPVATSDATLLAPEEVKPKPKGDIISKEERTATDKKRERRQKKKHQRMVHHEKEKREAAIAKVNPGLGNKYSKEKAVKLLEKVSKDSNVSLIENTRGGQATKSSTAFFSQLQDEVSSHIKRKVQGTNKRKTETKTHSAKRLKL